MANEVDYAADDVDEAVAIRRDVTVRTSIRPDDIDTLTIENGKVIGNEIKSSGRTVTRGDLGELAAGYQELIERGIVDYYRIVFEQLNPDFDLREYMRENNIPFEVRNPLNKSYVPHRPPTDRPP